MKHFDINVYLDNDNRYIAEVYEAQRAGSVLTTETARTLARLDVTGIIAPLTSPDTWDEDFEDYWCGTDDAADMPVALGLFLAPTIERLRSAE